MKPSELKQQMMKLWKDTFQDSDTYISMVFDNYFSYELVEYEERDGEVVAAMIAIPYDFVLGGLFAGKSYNKFLPDDDCLGNRRCVYCCPDCERVQKRCVEFSESESNPETTHFENENSEIGILSGLYLCGLATKPEYRGSGIMSRLIERINERAAALGYAFTFLIPASRELRNYYSSRGYINSFAYNSLNCSELFDGDDRRCRNVSNPEGEPGSSKSEFNSRSLDLVKISSLIKIVDDDYCCINVKFLFDLIRGLDVYIKRNIKETCSDVSSENLCALFMSHLCSVFRDLDEKYVNSDSLSQIHTSIDYSLILRDCYASGGDVFIGCSLKSFRNWSVDIYKSLSLEISDRFRFDLFVDSENNFDNDRTKQPYNLHKIYLNTFNYICDYINKRLSINLDVYLQNTPLVINSIILNIFIRKLEINSAAFVYLDCDSNKRVVKHIAFENIHQFKSIVTMIRDSDPGRPLELFVRSNDMFRIGENRGKSDYYGMLRPTNVADVLKMLCMRTKNVEFSALVGFDKKQFDLFCVGLRHICVNGFCFLVSIDESNVRYVKKNVNARLLEDIVEKYQNMAFESKSKSIDIKIRVFFKIFSGFFVISFFDNSEYLIVSHSLSDSLFHGDFIANFVSNFKVDNNPSISFDEFVSMLFSRVVGKGDIDYLLEIPNLNPSISLMLD